MTDRPHPSQWNMDFAKRIIDAQDVVNRKVLLLASPSSSNAEMVMIHRLVKQVRDDQADAIKSLMPMRPPVAGGDVALKRRVEELESWIEFLEERCSYLGKQWADEHYRAEAALGIQLEDKP